MVSDVQATGRYEDELRLLEQFHKSFKAGLPKQNKSKRWAVWILQGASLALIYRAIQFEKAKDRLALMMMMRLSTEFLNQIARFSDPNTTSEAAKVWMRVYAPLNYSTTLASIDYSAFKPGRDNRYRKKKRVTLPRNVHFDGAMYAPDINDYFSLYSHPSYNLARRLFETDKNNGSYDLYDIRRTEHDWDSMSIFIMMIIDNARRGIHVGSILFGDVIPLDDLELIRKGN